MAYDTLLTVIDDAAVELNLSSAVAVAVASTDPNILLLVKLLKRTGRALARARQWTHLVQEHTFTTTAATTYALPTDFRAMVPQTNWNRTSDRQLDATLGSEEWQYITGTGTSLVSVAFRIWKGLLYATPSTDTGNSIAFEYLSTYWVRATASVSPDKDAPTVDTDVIHLDASMVVTALKLAFRKAKGLNTVAAQQDFNDAWALATSDDSPAPLLTLDGGVQQVDPVTPENGWG